MFMFANNPLLNISDFFIKFIGVTFVKKLYRFQVDNSIMNRVIERCVHHHHHLSPIYLLLPPTLYMFADDKY